MAELKAEGRVVEARADLLVIHPRRTGDGPLNEETIAVREHSAAPGDWVHIYDDGSVDVVGRPLAGPREIVIPSSLDPDHS